MHSDLWFVTDGVRVISIFDNRKDAEREMGRYEDDPNYQYYDYYSVDVDDLEDYPDEFEMALEQGYLD